MRTHILRALRHSRRALVGLVAALSLLLATGLTAGANHTLGGPNEYRDCWLGSPQHYDECVEANNWGANFVFATETTTFVFPDRDDVSLTVGNIPSY